MIRDYYEYTPTLFTTHFEHITFGKPPHRKHHYFVDALHMKTPQSSSIHANVYGMHMREKIDTRCPINNSRFTYGSKGRFTMQILPLHRARRPRGKREFSWWWANFPDGWEIFSKAGDFERVQGGFSHGVRAFSRRRGVSLAKTCFFRSRLCCFALKK